MLKTFEEKIAYAMEKVKTLKEERNVLEKRVNDLEDTVRLRDQEIERLTAEKASIRKQIEDLIGELDSIEVK